MKTPRSWNGLRVGVLGLGRSGTSAARLLSARGASVYASDISDSEMLQASAKGLSGLGIDVELGRHDEASLRSCDVIIVSPGIPPSAPVFETVAGQPIISELELAWGSLEAPVIAVTGTNGKTTTTAWIGDMIERSGLAIAVGGNIGTPLSDLVDEAGLDWVVAEVSSFQLARTRSFAPAIGALLNLSADHLDRYESLEAYYADKRRLFDNASADSIWVLNGDDEAVRALGRDAEGRARYFSLDSSLGIDEEGAWVDETETLRIRTAAAEAALVRVDEIKLLGAHNVANALAASVVASSAGASIRAIRESLSTFEPLPHRLQPVAEVDGVLWINDSKATNVASARVAIRAVDRPCVVLLGGRAKGESFAALKDDLKGRRAAVIAYGEAAPQIVSEIGDAVLVESVDGPFEEVLRRGAELADRGDAVLLAPACASFDMFTDYVERGERFMELVRGMSG